MNHFAKLAQLLDLEAAAEAEALRRAAQAGADSDAGTTLAGLTLAESEYGLGGRLLLSFTLHGSRLPSSRLQPGSPVVVNQVVSHRRTPAFRGVVHDRDWTRIGVAIEPPDDDLDSEAKWRLDLAPDEISRLRQQQALRQAEHAAGNRLARLRDAMLGARVAEFDPPPEVVCETLNDSQCAAVAHALAANDVAVIHGPPGTGKTTTVVELIRQAVIRGERVLACAPSNAAVDNLLEKLLAAGEEPVRLGHPARIAERLRDRALDMLVMRHPDARQARKFVKEASALFRQADKWTREKPQPGEKAALRREARALLKEARQFEDLAADRILDDARIVCGTLTGLSNDLLGRRTYDLVVIDEAAQATEPAAWLPILRARRVVLAGDHRQLPPTILSPEAAAQGLSTSLMERLVATSPGTARLLDVQHRMHAAIMAFPNAEFYHGKLQAHDSVAAHLLSDLPGVTANESTRLPMTFIDTAGAGYDDEPDEHGSRRNPQEADLAAKQVRRLLTAGVAPSQIAVITPYRAQVRLLRERLVDQPDLEIDSVDGFQGREKEAVVISLVRSNPEGEIGFLADTRRTNVAMTRARRRLVIIGDSATLARHPFYERLVTHCERAGCLGSVWDESA